MHSTVPAEAPATFTHVYPNPPCSPQTLFLSCVLRPRGPCGGQPVFPLLTARVLPASPQPVGNCRCRSPPQLPGWGRAALNGPWEIITPICRSTNTAERRLGNTCLGILPYLYLACCLTNGIQLNIPALRTGRTRKPRSVDLYFFLVMTSFL